MSSKTSCEYPDAHEAHLAINGECPWCGAWDESKIVSNAEIDEIIQRGQF